MLKFIMARKELANGVCRLEYDTAECCFDGGDCGCKTCFHVRYTFKLSFQISILAKENFISPTCLNIFYEYKSPLTERYH